MPFDFDEALTSWKQILACRAELSPEYRNELESSLHDHYEAALIKGATPADAFAQASARVTPPPAASGGTSGVLGMLPHYLKIAGRQWRRRWTYTAVNFACLSIGVLTVALAVLYLDYETSYDTAVPDHTEKYRVGRNYRSKGYSVVSFPAYYGTEADAQMAQIDALESVPGVADAHQFYVFEATKKAARWVFRSP